MNVDANEPQASARAVLAPLVDALRRRLRDSDTRASWPQDLEETVRQVNSGADLPGRFTQAATSVGFEVHQSSPADWLDTVCEVLRIHDARAVVVNLDPKSPFGELAAGALCRRLAAEGFAPTTETDDETMFSADAGVTTVAAAIAESGSLVCSSSADSARGTSLIPPIHVAVVHTAQLVPDLLDYFAGLSPDADLPANINIITGPSKTSDIEGILVTGVHGPRHGHIVLVAG